MNYTLEKMKAVFENLGYFVFIEEGEHYPYIGVCKDVYSDAIAYFSERDTQIDTFKNAVKLIEETKGGQN